MARSQAIEVLRKMFQGARAADRIGMHPAEAAKQAADRRAAAPRKIGRRPMVGALGAAAGVLAVGSLSRPAQAATAGAKIAIIGGGIAGLNAALTLQDHGLASVIYEAAPAMGGRIHSSTDWEDGQTSEWCGEFIDSGHYTMIALAERFGLSLVDEISAQPVHSTDTLYFAKHYYGTDQAFDDFKAVAKIVGHQANKLWPVNYDPATQPALAKQLDAMSVYDWIEQYVPDGHDSPLGKYMDTAYCNEYGLDTCEQSALNIVFEMGFQPDKNAFAIYGESDQKYHVLGGNDLMVKAIVNELPSDNLKTRWKMVALKHKSDGRYLLTFDTPSGTKTATVDHVIMTIPFSVLRGLDTVEADFDAMKKRAIKRLGYGTNSKLIMQFSQRMWLGNGPWGKGNGNSYTDLPYENSWDSSAGIPGTAGVMVAFNGGSNGLALGAHSPWAKVTDPKVAQHVLATLKQLDKVYPGILTKWNGRATLSTPWADPNLLGSYACWKVGQYTDFAGYEGVRQANCHFAGEHTSTQGFQGFMQGAAEEGERAALEVLADLGIVV